MKDKIRGRTKNAVYLDDESFVKEQALQQLHQRPHIHFSHSICEKFPNHFKRWIRCPSNARWMLKNTPTSPLSNNQKTELTSVSKLDQVG